MNDYKDEVNNEQKFKPRLYTYPISDESAAVFDSDELAEEAFLVLCVRAHPSLPGREKNLVYVWAGFEFDESDGSSTEKFIEQVKIQYWGQNYVSEEIEVINELAGEESEEFLNFFD